MPIDQPEDPFFHQSDYLGLSLQSAATLLADGRYAELACLNGEPAAARVVTEVADTFVAWLRRPATLRLDFVAIEEQDNPGTPVPITRGENMAVTLTTGQQARFDIDTRDRRGFLTKAALDLTVTGDNITASVVDTPDPGTPNQLVVVATQPGAGGLVVLSVPNDETIADASEAFDVTAGGIASVSLGAPTIEDAP